MERDSRAVESVAGGKERDSRAVERAGGVERDSEQWRMTGQQVSCGE